MNVNVNVNNLLAIPKLDFDNSGEPGPHAKGVNHLETPLRQLHATHRASSCAKRGVHVQLCSKPRGGTRNRTRDLPKQGSAFIMSSDHWTTWCMWSSFTRFTSFTQGHRLEQAAPVRPGVHLGTLATPLNQGPAVRCHIIASWKDRASYSP